MKRRHPIAAPIFACLLLFITAAPIAITQVPSLQHLNMLKDIITTPAGPLPIWHIYAEPTVAGYRPVPAAGEGIACVDDVARALLVYLDHFEQTGDPASRQHAQDAIAFLSYTRLDNGTYVNFIKADGTLNTTGITSRPGINWWMARAMWGLARALVVFEPVDPEYAAYIHELLAPSVNHLLQQIGPLPGEHNSPPKIVGGGADVTAIFLLALSWLHTARPDPALKTAATALANGLRAAQAGDAATPPYRAVIPNPNAPAIWTGWGGHGMEALAFAGQVFDQPPWIDWAAETAHSLVTYMTAGPGTLAGLGPVPWRYPQIAYDVSPLVRGLVHLHHASANPLYSDLAFLSASWLAGNNPAGQPMFDAQSGRTYDGIDGDAWHLPARINYNAGAESTIEALSMLLALKTLKPNGLLADHHLAQPKHHGPVIIDAATYTRPAFGTVTVQRQTTAAGSRTTGGTLIVMHDGASLNLPMPDIGPGNYGVHLIHGAARLNTATVHIVGEPTGHTPLTVPTSKTGDTLQTTPLGTWQFNGVPQSVTIITEGGPIGIDAIVLHPLVMKRTLQTPTGHAVAIRNMTNESRPYAWPMSSQGTLHVYNEHGYRVTPEKQASDTVMLPPYGFGIGIWN